MKKASNTKLLTAKQARKKALSEKNFEIIQSIRQVSVLINKYTELGFTNIGIDVNRYTNLSN